MPRAKELYFAYPRKTVSGVFRVFVIKEFQICQLNVDSFRDDCVKNFKIIPIDRHRKHFVFSGEKLFLYEDANKTNIKIVSI